MFLMDTIGLSLGLERIGLHRERFGKTLHPMGLMNGGPMDAMVIATSPDRPARGVGGPVDAGAQGAGEAAECGEQAEIARVAAGDARAFEQLMRRHNTRMYRAARSILKN